MDYTGLEYSYAPPSYDFNAPTFDFSSAQVPDFSFNFGQVPSYTPPSFDLMSPMAGGYGTPSYTGPIPGLNEGMVSHNYQGAMAPPPGPAQMQQQPQGLGGMFGSLGLADWLKIAGAGAPLLAGLVGAFQGPQQGVTGHTVTQRPAAPPMSPYEQQALQAALLGTKAADPRLIEQAFQPQLGSLLQQAIEQARAAGFHTNPLESPVAERIMGQGLADLQGQMAAAKLSQGQYASTLGRGIAGDLAKTRGSDFIGGNTTSTTYGNQPSYWSSLSKDLGGLLGSLGGAMGTLRPSSYQQQPSAGTQQGVSLSGYR